MSEIRKALRVGLIVACGALWCRNPLFAQQGSNVADGRNAASPIISEPAADFEAKIVSGKALVRRKGTEEWLKASELNEPIIVGLLDSDHKIYVITKNIQPPKPKHTQDPEVPKSERKSGSRGQALLYVVVDDKGMVRLPTVYASTSPEYAKEAIKAVNEWRFQPAKLNDQPVSVLAAIEFQVNIY